MRPGIQRPRFLHLTEIDVERGPAPDIARCCIRAYASEQISNRFGIAQGTENGLDPCGRERRKEIPQVHPQHNALAHVGSDKRRGSPARMDVASTLNSDERDMTEKRQNA